MSSNDASNLPKLYDHLLNGSRFEGVLLVLLPASAWGLNWPVMKFLLTELPPFTMRSIAGGMAVLVALSSALLRSEQLRLSRSQFFSIAVLAALNYGIFGVFTTLSLLWLRASEAVVITYTSPVWALLLAWPILGERPSWRVVLGTLLALSGVFLLVGADEVRIGSAMLPGMLFGFLAAFCFGLGTVVSKQRSLELAPVANVAWQIGLGSVPMFILATFERPSLSTVTLSGWMSFAYIAFISTTLAYLAWFRALRLLPASIAATSVLVSPVVGVFSSAWLLGDPLGLRQLTALALTVFGIGMTVRKGFPERGAPTQNG
jgi:drug/metabolite transporter (DMT)-like permease